MLDFCGIGAQKAGTTWIYENLRRHPDISFPAGKEVHFWDGHYSNGTAHYAALFPENPSQKQGEITPAYAFLPLKKIQECRTLFPDLRLFYCIRNPIQRAWSGARMALKRAEMTLEEASDQWFLDHFHSLGSRTRGNYVSCVEQWLSVFPAEQLLLLRFDDILHQPVAMLHDIASHVGVDPAYFTEETTIQQPVHEGKTATIRPTLLTVLEELYAPDIEAMRQHPALAPLMDNLDA